MIEHALYDRLKAKGEFKGKKEKVISIDLAKEDNLYQYINRAKSHGILNNDFKSEAHRIRKIANSAIHKEDTNILDRNETLELIIDTVKLLEFVYK